MNKLTKQLLALAAATMFALPASALPYGGSGPGAALQGVLDGIAVDGDSDTTVGVDEIGSDELWSVDASGGAISTLIIELAGFATGNTFGIYDASDSSKTVELFAGVDAAGDKALLEIYADGSIHVNFADTGIDFAANSFGFYLDSSVFSGGGTFYSQSSLNSDGVDHMAAYQGTGELSQLTPDLPIGAWSAGEFILAWEDLDCSIGCDGDYTDFVVMVESVTPAPEPLTLSLLALGLIGVGAARRRQV